MSNNNQKSEKTLSLKDNKNNGNGGIGDGGDKLANVKISGGKPPLQKQASSKHVEAKTSKNGQPENDEVKQRDDSVLGARSNPSGKTTTRNLQSDPADTAEKSKNVLPPGVTITSPDGVSKAEVTSNVDASRDSTDAQLGVKRQGKNGLTGNGSVKDKKEKTGKLKSQTTKSTGNTNNKTNNTKDSKKVNSKTPNNKNRSTISEAKRRWNMIIPREVIAMAAAENRTKLANGTLPVAHTERRASLLGLPPPKINEPDKISLTSRQTSSRSLDSKSIDMSRIQAAVDAAAVATNNNNNETKDGQRKVTIVAFNDTWIRSAIPYLPVWLAVICFIFNILLPGVGTVISGLAVPCTGQPRISSKEDHVFVTLCVNVLVGVAQLFTVTFLLVGWFWSVAWGFIMLVLAFEYRKECEQRRQKEIQARALNAFGEIRPFSLRP